MGQHHWADEPDHEHDLELLAAVSGTGEVREPDEDAAAEADRLAADAQPDLRGDT